MHFYSYNWLFCNFFYLQIFCLLGNCTNLLLFSVCFLDKALISVIKNSLLVLISCVMLLILFSEIFAWVLSLVVIFQKQPSRGVLKKRCSENMQQIYRRTPMPTNKLPVLVSGGGGVIIIWSIRGVCYTFPVNCATCLLLLFIGLSFFLSGYQVYLKTTPWSNLPSYGRSLRP